MSKPFLTYEDQIIKLEADKNLIIDDKEYCKNTLKKIGYYSLIGGYKKPFRNPMTRKYINNVSFNDIVAIYTFDRKLRSLVMEYICSIERKFSNALSYGFCELFGEDQSYYLDSTKYTSTNTNDVNKLLNILKYNANISTEHDYLKYHRKKYKNVPLWVLLHGITFGQISKMYSLVIPQVKSRVCQHFSNLNPKELEQYIKVLVLFRNVCAHNECLFSHKAYSEIPDTQIHRKLNISMTGTHYDCGKHDLFAIVIAIRYLLSKEDYLNFKKQLCALVKDYCKSSKQISEQQLYEYMGFPANWKSIGRYKNI